MLNNAPLITHQEALLLGLTQNTSGSEFQAGLRSELTPSPLTRALTSMRSQIAAQTMIALFRYREALNYVAARLPVLKYAITQALPINAEHPSLLDPATGFAALCIELAEALPHSTVIEMDLPEVIRARQDRLQKAGFTPPENLRSIAANLSQTPLHEVLDGQAFDVLNFTGAYFTHNQLRTALRYIHSLLNPNGAVVSYLPWTPGVDSIKFAARFFKKQVGEYPGMMQSADQIYMLYHDAGFDDVTIHYPSQLADELGLPTPVLDIEVLVVGRK